MLLLLCTSEYDSHKPAGIGSAGYNRRREIAMKLKSCAFALAAAVTALTFSTSSHSANLLTNGSFEDATNFVDTPFQGQTVHVAILQPGSTAMPGWTVSNGDVGWLRNDSPFTGATPDGNYFLDLTGGEATPLAAVSQSFATEPGITYQVAFLLGTGGSGTLLSASETQGPVSLQAVVSGASTRFSGTFASVAGMSASPIWASDSFSFTADSASTVLTLQGQSRGPNGSRFIGLDAVSVTAVPEPTSLQLLLSGIVVLSFTSYRSRRRG
jgi:hypothetical protein